MTTTSAQLDEIRAELAEVANRSPVPVLIAMLDVLIEVACGENPLLRDYKRLQLYRGVRAHLRRGGLL